MKGLLDKKYGLVIVLALMIAYSVYFSALSIQRHNTLRTRASDLGQMDQALWNTLHGHLLEDTRDNPADHTARQEPRLTDHVEPIFFVVSLSYLIYDGVEAILVFQSIAIALGALPLFWIARRRLKSDWAGVAFAAMYLLFPALQAANLAEFHADTLAPAPLLFAFNYAEERAWARFALFSLVAMAVKEQIPLLVAAMGIWAAVKDQRIASSKFKVQVRGARFQVPAVPAVISVVAVVWFVIALFVIVPRFSPGGGSVYIGRYPCASQALKNPIMAIPDLVGCVLIPDKILYVVGLLASAGFIAILDPIILLLGAPALSLNVLSSFAGQYSGSYYYSASVAPYFVLAAIGGAARIRNSKFVIQRSAAHSLAVAVIPAFVVVLGYQLMAGYTPIGGEYFWPQITPHQELLARFIKEIPTDARVSTTSAIFPHISHRRFLYRFPTIQDADYVLLDVSDSIRQVPVDFRVDYLNTLKQGFGVRDAVDGYILLERGLTQTELPDEFYSFLRACPCSQPQQRVNVDFDSKIRFLGYDVRQDDWDRVYLRTYWTVLPGFDRENYALYPFFADENGVPRPDVRIPDLLVHFWYPTSRWQEGEVVIADSTPLDIGPRARIGLDVFFGATWENPNFRLAPQTEAPVAPDGSWVQIGELVKQGTTYRVINPLVSDPASIK